MDMVKAGEGCLLTGPISLHFAVDKDDCVDGMVISSGILEAKV